MTCLELFRCLQRFAQPRRGPLLIPRIKATRNSRLVAILACAGFLTGCAASLSSDTTGDLAAREPPTASAVPTAAPVAAKRPSGVGYKIGPHDVLEISVFKVPELSKVVQVAEPGTINLPLIGDVKVAGLTAQEIERTLTRRLGAKYLQNPQVTVYVREHNSQAVTVEGAVKKPGVYPFKGRNTLLQAIAMAEGMDAKADSTVVVFRMSENGTRTGARFDISDIRNGRGEDPPLQAGDVVVVGTSAIKESLENVMKVLPLAGVFAILAH